MRDFQLYVITDRGLCKQRDIIKVAHQAILGGADIIQLRDKEANDRELIKIGRSLKTIAHHKDVIFIVNDRVDVAIAINADGVHLGQDDLPINVARKLLGKSKIIGISVHSLKQALQAQADGADYIAVGPIFATPLKKNLTPVGLKLLSQLQENIRIPFVAIGGINRYNLKDVIKAGARRVAVARAVVGAKNIRLAAKGLKKILEE